MTFMSDESNSEDAVSQAEDIIRKARENTRLSVEMFGPLMNKVRNEEELSLEETRAIKIRDHCLKLIRAMNSLLPKPFLKHEIQARPQAVTNIGNEEEELRLNMGIKPKMHAGSAPESFSGNPLKASEWAASQLLFEARDRNVDLTWPRGSEFDQFKNSLYIQGLIELADHYFGDQLGTSEENLPKQK